MSHPMNTPSQVATHLRGVRMPVTTKLEAVGMLSDVLRALPLGWTLDAKERELRAAVKHATAIAVNEYHLRDMDDIDDDTIRGARAAIGRLLTIATYGTDPRAGTFRNQAAYAILTAHQELEEAQAAAIREMHTV